MKQYVSIAQPFLPLFNRSWTFEGWIYFFNLINGTVHPIVGQFESTSPNKYLHLIVIERRLRLGFFDDDIDSTSTLTASRWYHFASVFDSANRNQSIYLDGILDASRLADKPYLGTTGGLDIGVTFWFGVSDYFDGLIDQLSYTNRSKTSQEILRDATLTLYVSFDGNSIFDEGPLRINGSVVGSTNFVSGRQGQALQIDYSPDSYFTVQGLVLLGRSNQSYSFAIWIQPAAIQKSTVIHMSATPDGTGWRLPIIGLSSTNQLVTASWDGVGVQVTGPVILANSWTHVVSTYSLTNGLRLYANGSLCNASSPFSFSGNEVRNYLFVGSSRAAGVAAWGLDVTGQYSGAVDELRVYSRELTGCEINALANPGP